jgi:hypothetical protein
MSIRCFAAKYRGTVVPARCLLLQAVLGRVDDDGAAPAHRRSALALNHIEVSFLRHMPPVRLAPSTALPYGPAAATD